MWQAPRPVLWAALLCGLLAVRPAPAADDEPAAAASAPASAPARLHADIREATLRVQAQVKDAFGKVVDGELLVTTFRPPGPGPFPLVIISHGRNPDTRAEYKRQRYESASRFFVRKGFAVAVPLRLGYGELAGAGDPEDSIACDRPRFGPALAAAAAQILIVREAMARQPDIDAGRTLLVGQSVGGIATIAAAATHPPGLIAAINFAGGHGGSPDKHPGEPCQAEQLRQLYRAYGEANARIAPPTPTLWVYSDNDRYFGPRHARRWAAAYAEAGGRVDLRVQPGFMDDGHKLFASGNDLWQPLVDGFLASLGFGQPGQVAAPAAGPAFTSDTPAPADWTPAQATAWTRFLAAKLPRALAIGGNGRWGLASGDDALSRALALCERYVPPAPEDPPRPACRWVAHDDHWVSSTP